jgi:hypothetical protein
VQQGLEALAIADNIALVGAAYTPKSIDRGLRKIRESATALRKALEQPEQEPVAWDGYNLDDMCEAFDRVIEEHHQRKNPFHDPVNKDAMIALRVLRGFVPHMKLYTAPPAAQRKPLTDNVLVPLEILEAAANSLDSFCGNLGWGDADLQTLDNLFAVIEQHKAAHNIKEGT